jgi:uncharacterized protein YigE (DUF2233 family)
MRPWIALIMAGLAGSASAATCTDQMFEGSSLTVCDATTSDDLRLFHSGPDGIYGNFSAVETDLGATGQKLGFAMNAGMYRPDRAPVGLYVENGKEISPIVTRDGPGNFGLLPNGVFCIGALFSVIESRRFDAEDPTCRYATQSGPMLVIDGALHPDLLPDSPSLNIRNGVGVTADGLRAYFVISNEPVNFHRFARFFRDALGLPDALYLDGSISRLYAPELGRDDLGLPLGPIIGLVLPTG